MKLVFRLFPWHVGALNACRAFNFAAAPWKFARKLAARPTGSARHSWKIGVFRPCRFLDSGGLGLRTNAFAHFSAPFRRNNPSARPPSTNEQSHGGLCPHPPRNLRFLESSFRCRPLGRTIVPPRNAGASRDHRGAAPPPRTSPAPETHPSGQAPTTGVQTAPPKRGSNWVQAQPARRKPRPPRRSAAAPNFAHTRNAPQRSSADHRRADRAAQTRQQLGAGSACLSLLCGRGGRGGGSPGRSGG